MAQNPDWPRDSKSADDLFPRIPITVTKEYDIGYGPKKVTTVDYIHIEPNSHFFTDIDQILETLKYPSAFSRSHLIQGLENTKARGFKLVLTGDTNILGEPINDYLRDDDIHKMD